MMGSVSDVCLLAHHAPVSPPPSLDIDRHVWVWCACRSPRSVYRIHTHPPLTARQVAAKISAIWALSTIVKFNMVTEKASSFVCRSTAWLRRQQKQGGGGRVARNGSMGIGICVGSFQHTKPTQHSHHHHPRPPTQHPPPKKKNKAEVIDVEDTRKRKHIVDRETELALLPREDLKEVLTKHYPKYSRVFAQVGGVCVFVW